jgi:hypothetical protein
VESEIGCGDIYIGLGRRYLDPNLTQTAGLLRALEVVFDCSFGDGNGNPSVSRGVDSESLAGNSQAKASSFGLWQLLLLVRASDSYIDLARG